MIDYKKLGFKCGLELHVQLDTHKLFCDCPSQLRFDTPDYTIMRKLTSVAGEMGEIDVAAKLESAKDKTFIYECYDQNDCLVDIDEEPPHNIDSDALGVALQVAFLLNMKILDEIFVMRKAVVDGSNTAGFQRTALLGEDGHIDTKKGPVRVNMLSLEEDAGRKMDETDNTVTYRLDRIGIPLIELRTEPDIVSAEHAKETAQAIGMITRMTKRVARGLGTIRQDVNVSIRGGARTEIKGVQDLKGMGVIIDGEVRRQIHLLAIKDELKARDVKQSDIVLKKIDVSKLTKNAKQSFIKNSPVFGTRLFGFANVLGLEIQKGKRLGTEFSYYAKQYGSVSGIIHSDEDFEKYGLNKKEIAKKLRVKESDAFVLVAAKEEQARKALDAVIERAKQCIPGVPLEVRAAQSDGTTVFLRPIPGKARMYPETDLEPITISKDVLANVKKHLPKKPHELQADLEKMGLSKDLALQMVHSRDFILFEQLAKKFTDAKMIATLVLAGKGAVERSAYDALLKAYEKQVLSKEALTDAVPKLLEGEKISDILAGAKKVGIKIVEARIKTIAAKNKGKSFAAVMGDVMKEFRGKVDGKTLSELVKKHVNIKN